MKLSNEEVVHVADLAKLYLDESDYEKYGEQLYAILSEIDKIENVKTEELDEILIAPTSNENGYSQDQVGRMLSHDQIFLNVKNTNNGYIVVPKVIND